MRLFLAFSSAIVALKKYKIYVFINSPFKSLQYLDRQSVVVATTPRTSSLALIKTFHSLRLVSPSFKINPAKFKNVLKKN
jgi:hypothetical protein